MSEIKALFESVAKACEEYQTRDDLTITNPGKFEGEPIFVPALWDMALEGFSDETVEEDGVEVSLFHFSGDEGILLGLLCGEGKPISEVRIWETDQGFVTAEIR